MQGEDFNLEALEEEYRLPTLAGLRICVTGFEDCERLQRRKGCL